MSTIREHLLDTGAGKGCEPLICQDLVCGHNRSLIPPVFVELGGEGTEPGAGGHGEQRRPSGPRSRLRRAERRSRCGARYCLWGWGGTRAGRALLI